MNIEFDDNIEKDMDFYCEVLGLTREEFISEAVTQYILYYQEEL